MKSNKANRGNGMVRQDSNKKNLARRVAKALFPGATGDLNCNEVEMQMFEGRSSG